MKWMESVFPVIGWALPKRKLLTTHLPESLVLYKPKDMVAGHFYRIVKAEDYL